jgi:hypothetical protein
MNTPDPKLGLARLLWCGFGMLMVILALITIEKMVQGRDGDMHSFFYTAARLMIDGTWRDHPQHALAYTAIPVALVPIMALALLPYLIASAVWATLSVLFLTAAAVIASACTIGRLDARVDAATMPVVAILGVAIVAANIVADLNLGQMDLLTTFLLILAFHWLRTRPIACGLCLAIASTMKFFGILFLPWLLLRRAWKQAATLIVGSIALWAVMIPFLGLEVSSAGLRLAFAEEGRLQMAPTSGTPTGISISAGAGLQRATDLLLDASLIPWAVPTLLGLVGLFGITLYRVYRQPLFLRSLGTHKALDLVEFGAIPTLAIAIATGSHSRHGCMALLSACILAAILVTPGKRATRIMALLAMTVIVMSEARLPDALGISDAWHWIGGFGWVMLVLGITTVWCVLSRCQDARSPRACATDQKSEASVSTFSA